MTGRTTKIKLAVFGALGITGILLIFVSYVPTPSMLGFGQNTVVAQFSQVGNLYPNANVLYQGVPVGEVTDTEVAPAGVNVTMSLDEATRIPRDVRAEVHNTSAIGDKYLGLTSQTRGGPYLDDGDVIGNARTSVPVSTARVLDGVDQLLASVPKAELSIVLTEVSAAFRGLGPDLRSTLDSASALVASGQANLTATNRLIDDTGPALRTQQATSAEIRSLTRDVASLSSELRRRDPELERVLNDLPGAADEARTLVGELRGTLPSTLQSTGTLTRLLQAYNQPLEHTLVVFPMVLGMLVHSQVDEPDGFSLNLDLVQNYPSCTIGWTAPDEAGGARPYTTTSDAPLPPDTFCKLPQDSQRVARGARNLPCFEPGSPPGRRAATIEQCRGDGYQPTGTQAPLAFPGEEFGGQPLTGSESPLGNLGAGNEQDPVDPLSAIGGAASESAPRDGGSLPGLLLGEDGR